jgi:hypothetical protein
MKKFIFAMALAGFISAPVFAQEAPPEGEKSMEELMKDLHKLMKRASDEMGELEAELNKASREAPKADVIAERMEKIRKAMEQGKVSELPEGLAKYFKENPGELAKASSKSEEEIRKLAEDTKSLEELLNQHPELLKKLASSAESMEGIERHQHEAERKLEETLKKQRDAADAAKKDVNDAINVAHQIKAQSQSPGSGQPKNGDQQTQDPKKGEGQQGSNNPSKGAEGQYNPGEGNLKDDEQVDEYASGTGDGAQMEKKGKEMGNGAGSDERAEPTKYKGFWKKFTRETQKKAEEKK